MTPSWSGRLYDPTSDKCLALNWITPRFFAALAPATVIAVHDIAVDADNTSPRLSASLKRVLSPGWSTFSPALLKLETNKTDNLTVGQEISAQVVKLVKASTPPAEILIVRLNNCLHELGLRGLLGLKIDNLFNSKLVELAPGTAPGSCNHQVMPTASALAYLVANKAVHNPLRSWTERCIHIEEAVRRIRLTQNMDKAQAEADQLQLNLKAHFELPKFSIVLWKQVSQ